MTEINLTTFIQILLIIRSIIEFFQLFSMWERLNICGSKLMWIEICHSYPSFH
ncbi:hypothetical protein [Staphylococcus phage phiSa2wa-st5.6]|nr:hypothetical protein [Staphylococcus phage phiSa2wa-st5.6]